MSESDLFVERRKLKRSRGFWRAAAFVALGVAVVAGGIAAGGGKLRESRNHIARIAVEGTITGDEKTLELLKRAERSSVKGVVLVVDSPGGTVSGSEAVYGAVRRIAETKPVVAVVDGMAASGGYIAALGAERIVSRETSIVGSIGVLFQYPNVVGMLDKLGIRMEGVKSGPLKAAPNPVDPMTPESRAALEEMIGDSFEWFKRLVRERRGLSDAELSRVADGRVFSGRQEGLVARTQPYVRGAVEWLKRDKALGDLPVTPYKRDDTVERLGLVSTAAFVADLLGADRLAVALRRNVAAETPPVLDGLLALWHPAAQN